MTLQALRAEGRPSALVGVVAAVLLALGLAACSEEVVTDYSAVHRDAFLDACSRPLDDPRLLSDVCVCVYDRIEDEVPFDEFEQMSERLAGSTAAAASTTTNTSGEADVEQAADADLPDDIAIMVADCFTAEADL